MLLRRVSFALLGLIGLTLAAILAGPSLTPACTTLETRPDRYDVAIILGGGMHADGRLKASSRSRIAAGVALYQAGRVDGLHMTGAGPTLALSAGAAMAIYAQGEGVPPAALSIEEQSYSTLQNALFSMPRLGADDHSLLITEGFHLSRSWASFAWAGARPDALCHAAPLVAGAPGPGVVLDRLTREVLATWFNLLRGAGFSLARGLGADPERLEPLLR